MFNFKSAIELVEKLTTLKMAHEVTIVDSTLIKENISSRFNLHLAQKEADITLPDLPVFDVLGDYDPKTKQITIYNEMIRLAVKDIDDGDIDFETLKDVIVFHEITHAVTHIGKDAKGRVWQNFEIACRDDKELFAQLYPYVLFNNLDAFSKHLYVHCTLSMKYQTKRYNTWIMLRDLTLDEINQTLSRARENKVPFPDFFVEISHAGGIPLVAEVAPSYRIYADGSCYSLKLSLNKIPIEKPKESKDVQILRIITESPSKLSSEKLIKARRLLPELEKTLEKDIKKEDFYNQSALFKIMETLIDFDDGITEKIPFPNKVNIQNVYMLYKCTLPLLYIPRKIFGPLWAMDAVETTITIFWCGKLWGTWTAINDDWGRYGKVFAGLKKIIRECLTEAGE